MDKTGIAEKVREIEEALELTMEVLCEEVLKPKDKEKLIGVRLLRFKEWVKECKEN